MSYDMLSSMRIRTFCENEVCVIHLEGKEDRTRESVEIEQQMRENLPLAMI